MEPKKDTDALFGTELRDCDQALRSAVSARVRLLATELYDVAVKYESQYTHLLESATERTAAVRYATGGGTTARRGYFTPSPIIHQLASNTKMSRPLKELPKSGDYFAYRLDAEGRLLRVDQYAKSRLSSQELLVWDDPSTVYGLTFLGKDSPMLMMASQETYDERGRIASLFEMKMPLLLGKNLFSYEKYYYDGATLEGADVILQGIYGGPCRFERYVNMGSAKKLTLKLTSSQTFTIR